ncbi:hypothetical protein DV735_g1505, partial [Chaetothyriales sp. CBS 134920]
MATSRADADVNSHPTNSAPLDHQSASSNKAVDFGDLLPSSNQSPMGAEAIYSNTPLDYSGHLWSEYTPLDPENPEISALRTNPQDFLDPLQFCETDYPSPNTTSFMDLMYTPKEAESQSAELDIVDISSDDEDADRVISPPPFQDPSHLAVKEESPETDQVLCTRTSPFNAETTSGGELPKDCQQVLEEFMANVGRQSQDVDMGGLLLNRDEGNELSPEIFSGFRETCEIKEEHDATSDHFDLNGVTNTGKSDPTLLQNMQENADLLNEQDSLFFPDSHLPASGIIESPAMQFLDHSIAAYQPASTAEHGLEQSHEPTAQSSRHNIKGKDRGRAKVGQEKVRKRRGTASKKAGSSRKAQHRNMFEMESLLPYDLPRQVQANLKEPSPPRFTSTKKNEALKQLIASIPEPQRELHRQDKSDLLLATMKFKGHGAMRPDGEGKWRLRGMKTALHHYQVMGMRENEEKGLRGGILADDMGLGKTVMALANIINGSPDGPGDSPKATLIVTPASLTLQWFSEVLKHVDMTKNPKQVMVYRSAKSDYSSNAEFSLGLHDIVITSYNELNKSMPNNKPPPNLVTSQAKEEWFEEYFKTHRGALHKVSWLRIVLDEAHAIKNHESKTSNAAHRLRARYRWALSGTPVQNSLTEFFAYFRFLRAHGTGNFKLFRQNYCKRGSEKALQRLRVRLEGFVIRRTHQDILFGRPIIQLPPIENRTVKLQFSRVEQTVYDIVHQRFTTKVEELRESMGSLQTQRSYGAIYVLLLRFRQLTAHILLIENTLNDLLEPQDLDQLWNLIGIEQSQLGDADRKLLHGLEMVLKIRKEANRKHQSQKTNMDKGQPTSQTLERQDSPLSHQFHEYLASMRGSGRGKCAECGEDIDGIEELVTTEESADKVIQTPQHQQDEEESSPPGSGSDKSFDWFRHRPVPLSTKLGAVVKQMQQWFAQKDAQGNDNKVLVFSQFKGVLKAFSTICNENGWKHELFHGDMGMEARSRAIETFSSDDNCKALLAGMKCGGVGLNLTAANKVIIIDLWWNIAAETQAFCRVFRIGQERPCEVVRFAIKDTIDTDILGMQERKSQEIESGMAKDDPYAGLDEEEEDA